MEFWPPSPSPKPTNPPAAEDPTEMKPQKESIVSLMELNMQSSSWSNQLSSADQPVVLRIDASALRELGGTNSNGDDLDFDSCGVMSESLDSLPEEKQAVAFTKTSPSAAAPSTAGTPAPGQVMPEARDMSDMQDNTNTLRNQKDDDKDENSKEGDNPISVSFSQVYDGNVGQVTISRVTTRNTTCHMNHGDRLPSMLSQCLTIAGVVGFSWVFLASKARLNNR